MRKKRTLQTSVDDCGNFENNNDKRLIAAAPELYEALYKITKEQECGQDCIKCTNHGCVIKECKAALANAAGESEVKDEA